MFMRKNVFLSVSALGFALCACSTQTAGTSEESEGIIANLDVAGVSQKGPFVKGSAVTVQGIDCKTMKFSDEVFEGKVKSDKGDFAFDDVTLSSTCAVFEATGKYRSEITGKESAGEITLHALTDLKDRENVNINVFTELEYERLMYLVTEKGKKFAEAKEQAEKEVLAAFDIAGSFEEFENLNIFEAGDENAALLAVSVMIQAETDDAGLAKRVEKFVDSFAESGKWKDSDTKKAISEWAVEATANGKLDSIRKNVEAWNDGDKVAAFEKFIEAYADGDSIILSSSSFRSSSSTPVGDLSSSSAKAGSEYDATANTLKDLRDGQVYKTVKIGDQVWMAENLNFETDSSFCYRDSAYFCAMHGRLYKWAAAVGKSESECGYGNTCSLPSGDVQGVCPSGWHLPSKAEFESLIATVGEDSTAGKVLKSASGWSSGGNGLDDFGFAALPAGDRGHDGGYSGAYFLAFFWSSTEINDNNVFNMYLTFNGDSVHQSVDIKDMGNSVRCVKDDGTVPESSSGVTPQSSSGETSVSSSSSVTLVAPCKTETEDNCEYGTLTDERDGQTYKTVKIGDQVWMAENLNIAAPNSYCYHDSAEYCSKYGRLYNWAGAMDAEGKWSTNSVNCRYTGECSPTYPVRGACPEGWHLPDSTEWGKLLTAVGGLDVAAKMLKSTSGWQDCEEENCNGTDAYGFSALPAGYKDRYGSAFTYYEGVSTGFYTSTQVDKNDAYRVYLYRNNVVNFTSDIKADGFSVRCVKD